MRGIYNTLNSKDKFKKCIKFAMEKSRTHTCIRHHLCPTQISLISHCAHTCCCQVLQLITYTCDLLQIIVLGWLGPPHADMGKVIAPLAGEVASWLMWMYRIYQPISSPDILWYKQHSRTTSTRLDLRSHSFFGSFCCLILLPSFRICSEEHLLGKLWVHELLL